MSASHDKTALTPLPIMSATSLRHSPRDNATSSPLPGSRHQTATPSAVVNGTMSSGTSFDTAADVPTYSTPLYVARHSVPASTRGPITSPSDVLQSDSESDWAMLTG